MMSAKTKIGCVDFPCQDVKHDRYQMPQIDRGRVLVPQIKGPETGESGFWLESLAVKLVMISEATPDDPSDYFYSPGDPLFQQTTVLAFRDAGVEVDTIQEILNLGVYLTSAIKCAKKDYVLKAGTITTCSFILERELDQFPNASVYLLMGDAAIKAVNAISRRHGLGRVIPAGSTYKIRGSEYRLEDKRVFPSYLQAGPAFFIEKSKRMMIAEDIRNAMALI